MMQGAMEVGAKEGAMRCPKCGYVSFDYLARCRKCSRDLADTRLALNLLDVKPATPFLLASLVDATAHDTGRERVTGLSLTQESELELGSLEMPAPVGLDETMEGTEAAPFGTTAKTASPGMQSSPGEMEPSSFDLSLDDLALVEDEKTEGQASGADEGTLDLDLQMDDEGPGEAGDELSLDEATPEAISEDLDLDLDGPAASGPARRGSASDDGIPDLEEALLEMEKNL
jgi:hypothetical protein